MVEAFRLCWIEMRKTLARSVLYAGIALAVMMGLIVAVRGRQFPGTFETEHALYFYGNAAEIFMAVLMAKALGDEFYYKTSTVLFSSSCSRTKILAIKGLYHVWIALVFAVGAIGVSWAAEWILHHRVDPAVQTAAALRIIPIYLLFAAAGGSFLMAVGTITLNIVGPLIAYVAVFWFLPGTLELLLKQWFGFENAGVYLSPLYLRMFLTGLEYSARDIFALIVFGAVCFASAAVILNRRDLR